MKKKVMAIILACALLLGITTVASAATGTLSIDAVFSNISIILDGQKLDLKNANGEGVEPFVVNGTTYLPVRALAEALGLKVDWDQFAKDGSQVILTSKTDVVVEKIVANCESDAFGRAIHSFTFYVDSVVPILDLSADDFHLVNCVYDRHEYHDVFSAPATNVTFTADSMTVEVEPFYPGYSATTEGYWKMTCTNEAFNLSAADAETRFTYVDPVVDAFVKDTLTYKSATTEYFLFTPEGDATNMPLVFFNSGGTGVSTSNGTPYGSAQFAVSIAKDEVQKYFPCYVLYPQRNEGEDEDMIDAIKSIIDGLVEEGKVDPDRIYISGESAGAGFTHRWLDRHPGYCAAAVIFDGGGNASDESLKTLAESGTKVMYVQSIGDTTALPDGLAYNYNKLVEYGMKPGLDVIWHAYTAETFNALLNDRTKFLPMNDSNYVTDPVTGVTTYDYPEGKLHNGSFAGSNDDYIKLWLKDQSRAEYSVEFNNGYSAQWYTNHPEEGPDYSIIPEQFTRVSVVDDVPLIPAGTKGTATVYSDDAGEFWYISFETFFQRGVPQYVEALNVGGSAVVVMDCSGSWWTNDITFSTMPYLLALEAEGGIDWQPYVR